MASYEAPVRDMRFAYYELHDGAAIQRLPGYGDADEETVVAVLEEAGKFCTEQLLPINRSGDEEGCHFEDGQVRTPVGFKAAYQAFIENGWNSIAFDTEYGGQGLPKSLHLLVDEIINATNLSFGLYPGLTNGAWTALSEYASDDLKDRYFPKMAEGVWSATMCLTEPQSGSDLALVRTKAEPNADGSFDVTGTKIFTTAGDHDLTENIVHLVLARTPEAPAGIKGISLFLVPKFVVTDDSDPGEANGVSCGSIEHKMGIKASATCVINFDAAKGWLVGEQHKGMRAMFRMMNTERLAIGVQGIGIAETAYQNAVTYARERLQGRAPNGAKLPNKAADPLIVHPDVRRMLLTMRAYTEGCRMLAVWIAQSLDIANRHEDSAERQAADDLVALLTPLAKAFFTDIGSEVANLAVQVYGGHGYVREHGMEQLVRDARIAQIYEGTNGIQAMDLVGRKIQLDGGHLMKRFMAPTQRFISDAQGQSNLAEFIAPLDAAITRLNQATDTIRRRAAEDPAEVGAAAVDYLRLFALTALAFLWARSAAISISRANSEDARFYNAKIQTARFFMQRLLPQTEGLLHAIESGAAAMMAFDDEAW